MSAIERAVYRTLRKRERSKAAKVRRGSPLGRYSDDLDCELHAPDYATVYERDEEPVDSGLLDQHGNRLYRMPRQKKIGFL